MKAYQPDTEGKSLWYIFLMGLLGGIIALFTPCVWPIIPMTVSFFLHRSGEKGKGVRDAIIYGISIIIIYMTLALVITALFGPQTLNEMSTNAPFNIFFFLLLVVFALSFFGMFELALPSSWGNKVDSKASATTGLLSIFLMAFTLSLVSFSCTAPVVSLFSSGSHKQQLGGTGHRHVRLCPGVGSALHPLCDVPKLDEESPEVGLVDEHGEGGTRIRRTGASL